VISSETAPLAAFGADARTAVRRRLSDAGVRIRSGTFPTEYADGKLRLEREGPVDVDLVIALPHLRGTQLPGLPHDSGGFVPVDGYGRVLGLDRVWAVGDMTARPVKQGGLAAQQADVAAADIAAQLADGDTEVHPYQPKLEGMLLTGADPLYLQRDPLVGPQQKVVGAHLGPYLESLDRAVAVG
jgi:sulfide:quinone oxidoreductase